MSRVVLVRGSDRKVMVERGLTALGIAPRRDKVVIKPNLIINRPYPVTTHPELVECLLQYFAGTATELIVAEGSGFCRGGTMKAYRELGYEALAERWGIPLVDLTTDSYELVSKPDALRLQEFKLPCTLKDAFVISAAVLKRHSMTRVTLSLKNMMGATIGRKARFHALGLTKSIVDIVRYTRPGLAVIDGIASCSGEMGGEVTWYELMLFSADPVAADAVGAHILGVEPFSVPHLKLAHETGLGVARLDEIELEEV